MPAVVTGIGWRGISNDDKSEKKKTKKKSLPIGRYSLLSMYLQEEMVRINIYCRLSKLKHDTVK